MDYDIALFKGHGMYGGTYDPGAVFNGYKEQDIVSKIVDEAYKLLTGLGIRVLTGENNFQNRLLRGHTLQYKTAYSVHANIGRGTRSEFLVPKGESYFKTEDMIGKAMISIGIPSYQIKSRDYTTENFINRTDGVKLSGTDWYKEIREAWEQGISLTIFETGFMDSSDLNVLLGRTSEIAFILASHLALLCDKKLTKPVVPVETKPVTEPSGGLYRVIVGSFKEKSNATTQQEKLKKAGFDSFLEYKK